MGDVNQHAPGINLAATNILVERREYLVDLDGKGARFGLSFTLSDGLFPQLGQIFAAHGGREFNLFQRLAQGTILDQQFQMHLRLALKLGHAGQEPFAVQANRTAQRIVSIKYRAKTERQDGGALEALADHVRVLQQRCLAKIASGDVLTHEHGKITAGIRKNLGVSDAFKTFYGDGTAGANSTLDRLLLNDAVRVPCHEGASPVGKTFRAGEF